MNSTAFAAGGSPDWVRLSLTSSVRTLRNRPNSEGRISWEGKRCGSRKQSDRERERRYLVLVVCSLCFTYFTRTSSSFQSPTLRLDPVFNNTLRHRPPFQLFPFPLPLFFFVVSTTHHRLFYSLCVVRRFPATSELRHSCTSDHVTLKYYIDVPSQ